MRHKYMTSLEAVCNGNEHKHNDTCVHCGFECVYTLYKSSHVRIPLYVCV